jgi:hypothetical protein
MVTHIRPVLAALLVVTLGATAAGGQVPLRNVMRNKLGHAQAILGAVVTSDWAALGREARALEVLTHDPAWDALVTTANKHRTDIFRLALQDLIASADKQNLDDAVMAQVSVNLNCVRCHQMIARSPKLRAGGQ